MRDILKLVQFCLRTLSLRLKVFYNKIKVQPVHVGFVVDKLALGQVFFAEYLRFPLSLIIPPMLHIHSYIPFALLSQQLTASFDKTQKIKL